MTSNQPKSYHPLLISLAVIIIAIFFLFPPVTILDKSHAVGYAICHQFPARTFHLAGIPLPLCARCTGIYLGALLGVAGLVGLGRHHFVDLPPTRVLVLLISFILLMGFDGINSYLDMFPALPQLYEPQNWLRLVTGTFHGLAISIIIFPIITVSLWHPQDVHNAPVIKGFKELLPFLGGAGLIILLVLWQHPLLLYPLTILSTLGVLLMLGLLNTALVLVITKREGYARSWRDALVPAAMGLAAAFLLIGGIDWLRFTLTSALDIPL